MACLLSLMLETGLKRDEVVALGFTDVVLQPGMAYLVVRETEQAKRLRSRRLEIGERTQRCSRPSWRGPGLSASLISHPAA